VTSFYIFLKKTFGINVSLKLKSISVGFCGLKVFLLRLAVLVKALSDGRDGTGAEVISDTKTYSTIVEADVNKLSTALSFTLLNITATFSQPITGA
jgi:hypothetical protein